MKNRDKKLFILLMSINALNYPMCFGKRKAKPVKPQTSNEITSPKAQLMQLINNADLAGVRTFTQTGNAQYIDKEACTLAKEKFEATKTSDPAQFARNNQLLVMVMVQAMAPAEVKKELGLPH